jgi:8-oxo-dGTP pyrophosphatase MutT (NUDIX family)
VNQNLKAGLEKYVLSFPAENESADLFLDFLTRGANLSTAHKRGHITASAWIINHDRTRVLLTHHAKLDKWFQLGGHVDGGEGLPEAAQREAHEESGLSTLLLLDRDIFDIDAHLIPERGSQEPHYHFDIRFLFQADSSEPLIISSESKELLWVTPEEAIRLNPSPSLTRMIEKTMFE